jgi:hypothetical protein
MAHSLHALRPPVRIWDRQGQVPTEWFNLSQALDDSGLEPRILAPEGSFGILLRVPADAANTVDGINNLLEQRNTWHHRLHWTTVAVWWPAGETLYQLQCVFDSYATVNPHKPLKEWTGEMRFHLEPRGSHQRTQIPVRLQPHLAILAAFELDPDAEPIYRDWCREHDWPERFPGVQP